MLEELCTPDRRLTVISMCGGSNTCSIAGAVAPAISHIPVVPFASVHASKNFTMSMLSFFSFSFIGADLSDYFNYGFNEDTWKAYCEKQKRLRMGLDVMNISSTTSKITVGHVSVRCFSIP